MRIVVAVGGNALIEAGQDGHLGRAAATTCAISPRPCSPCAARGTRWCSRTATARTSARCCCRTQLGEEEAAPLPLDALIAMTQGQIGYLLESAFASLRPDRARPPCCSRGCSSTPTTRRSARRPSPSAPSTTRRRPSAGPLRSAGTSRPTPGRGWRRVVPSPQPLEVLGRTHVATLLERGAVVISCGGGGIPVHTVGHEVVGVAGVIDKDRCSAQLALEIGADVLVLLTGVRRVALDFGTRWERELARLTVSDALRGLADGDFPRRQHGSEDRVRGPVRRRVRRPRGGDERGVPRRRGRGGGRDLDRPGRPGAVGVRRQRGPGMSWSRASCADRYVDSVRLMKIAQGLRERDGVGRAELGMGTPANLETLAGMGVSARPGRATW